MSGVVTAKAKGAKAKGAKGSKAPAEKLARQRLSVLELALALGSVREACRQRAMRRPPFYAYKRRFQQQGLAGLKDLPPIHTTHPQTPPPAPVAPVAPVAMVAMVARIVALCLERPGWAGAAPSAPITSSRSKASR